MTSNVTPLKIGLYELNAKGRQAAETASATLVELGYSIQYVGIDEGKLCVVYVLRDKAALKEASYESFVE